MNSQERERHSSKMIDLYCEEIAENFRSLAEDLNSDSDDRELLRRMKQIVPESKHRNLTNNPIRFD